VRRDDVLLRDALASTLDRIRPQVDAVLRDYDVPR
jgi:hypothetical protein